MKRPLSTFVALGVVLALVAGVLFYRQLGKSGRGETPDSGRSANPPAAGAAPTPTPGAADQVVASPSATPVSSPTRAASSPFDQPPDLRPASLPSDSDWKLLDWSVSPFPGKPSSRLRASAWAAPGKHSYIRVEEEIDASSPPQVLHRKEMVGNQIIVKLPSGSAQQDAEAMAERIGAKAGPAPFAPETWLFMLERELDAVPQGMESLRSSGADIEYTEPDLIVRPARLPNDPRVTDFTTWYLHNNTQLDKDIKAAKAWDRRTSAAHGTTNKVIVAVLDTGVRYTHQDLSDNMWRNPRETAGDGIDNDGNGWVDDIHGIDPVGGDANPMDTNGHGTHCSGLIGAVGNNGVGLAGVSWAGIEIMALRFIDGTGSLSDEVTCMDYARLQGAKVINGSFGQDGGPSLTEINAINRLNSSGVILVAAAGNGGADSIGDNNNGIKPFYPASYANANIIAVGATDRNDNKTGFSNFGATAVDLFAPGDSIYSTRSGSDTEYGSGNGTSYAAPLVSGDLALLIAEYPNDTVAQRVARLVNINAVDVIPALSGLCVTGGRLNLAKLLPAADPDTLQQALVWHRPAHNEGLINSLMRTPVTITTTNVVTVYSGMRKFNNTNGVNTSGLVNQTGGWLFHRPSSSVSWSSNALSWHSNNGDYQFWRAALSNLPSGTIEYYLQFNFDSGARTTYSFSANNADGFSAGTNEVAAQSSPYTFTVSKATAAVAIANTNQTFNGTPRSVSVTTTPAGLATAVTYNGSATPPTNAGTYTVVATVTDANYDGTASGTLTIGKATAGVTFGSLAQTYDGTSRTVLVTTTPPGLATTVTYNGSSSPPVNAGSYTVVATVSDANYQGLATNTLTVGKATPVVTTAPSATAITYGQTLASSVLSGGAANVPGTFSFTTPTTAPAAGSSSQSVTFTPTDGTNYSTAVTNASVTVNKATASLIIGNLAQGYDGTARAVSVTTTPPGLAVSVTYNGSPTPPVEAGTYNVVATINDSNYQGSATATLTVKALATVVIGGLSKTYDTTVHAVTVTTTPAGLPLVVTYNGSSEAPVNAGTYEVVAMVNHADYHGSATATLTIAKATPSITEAPVASAITYEQALAESVLSGGAASVPGTFDFTDPYLYPEAGTASQSVTFTPDDAANYESVQTNIDVVVNKAEALLEIYDLEQVYDGAPRLVAVYTEPYEFTTTVTYDGSEEPPTNAGSYEVVATVDDPNYEASATATLVVAKASANVEISGLEQTYDGTPRFVSAVTDPVGLSVAVTYDGGASPPVGGGTYAVEATINDANYEGTAVATLNVAKATAGVVLGNLSQIFDGTSRSVSVTTTPPGLASSVTYNGGATPPTNAGNYTVVATVNDANYQGSATNTLTVGQATPVISAAPSASAITYGQTLSSSVLTGGSANVSGTFAFTTPSLAPAAGTASQSLTFNPMDSNYTSVATSTVVTVNKATATVTLGNLSQNYDGTPRAVSTTTTPPGLAVDVTYDGSPTAPTAAGSYAVVATINDANCAGSASGILLIDDALPTFGQWIGQFNGLSDLTPGGDPDGDGLRNAEEYFMALDPTVPDAATALLSGITFDGVYLDYRRSKQLHGVTGTVKWSTHPGGAGGWTHDSVTDVQLQDHDTWELRRASVPWLEGAGQIFLRLDLTME
jgi:subtilisin family serine protease